MKNINDNFNNFEKEMTTQGTTIESVLTELEQELNQPMHLIEVQLDRFIMDYLAQTTKDYCYHGTFGNYSIRLNDDLGSYMEILAIEEGETDNELYQMGERESRYLNYQAQGLIDKKYTRMKVALTEKLIGQLTVWGKLNDMTFETALNHCMCHWIFLQQILTEQAGN